MFRLSSFSFTREKKNETKPTHSLLLAPLMSSTSREEGGYGGGKKTNEGKKKKKKYYAVARGRTVGVYDTWDECNAQVRAYPGASHKVYIYRDTLCISHILFPLLEEQRAFVCRPSALNATRRANEPYLFF